MAKSTAVATKAEAGLPASASFMNSLADTVQSGGTGLENVTSNDIIIPRITILQALSPQVIPSKPEFDQTARVGEIYDTGLQQRFPDGLEFIPVHYVKEWLEWGTRESGKGLVATHTSEQIMKETTQSDVDGRYYLTKDTYVMETAQFTGLNVTADFRKCFIPMSSTQLKKARRIMTLALAERIKLPTKEIQAPLYYNSYTMTTVPETNRRGDWNGWKVDKARTLDQFDDWENLLEEIKVFRDQILGGVVKGDIESMNDITPSTDNNGRM